MRWSIVLALALTSAVCGPSVGAAQRVEHALGPSGPHDEADWQAWRGRDEAQLTADLGRPDRIDGPRWSYESVRVGSPEGPFVIWRLSFVVRGGHVASVRAVRVASVGCEITESIDTRE